MYEIQLENGEIVNYNKLVSIVIDDRRQTVGLVVTNYHLMIFENKNHKIDFMEILQITRGVQNPSHYQLTFKEKLKKIQCHYEEKNTVFEVDGKTITVLEEHVPFPIFS